MGLGLASTHGVQTDRPFVPDLRQMSTSDEDLRPDEISQPMSKLQQVEHEFLTRFSDENIKEYIAQVSRHSGFIAEKIVQLLGLINIPRSEITAEHIASLTKSAEFSLDNPDITLISQEAREEIARLTLCIEMANAMEELFDTVDQGDSDGTIKHIRNVSSFAPSTINVEPTSTYEQVASVISSMNHDIGKLGIVLSDVQDLHNLGAEQRARISEHSYKKNPFVARIPHPLVQAVAIGHHSMDEEEREVQNALGKNIKTASHDEVLELLQRGPIPFEIGMRTLLRTKVIDTFEASLSKRPYRKTPLSFEHAMYEAIHSSCDLDSEGTFKIFFLGLLKELIPLAESFETAVGRTNKDFETHIANENKTCLTQFRIDRKQLKASIANAYGKAEHLAKVIQGLGEEVDSSTDTAQLEKQLANILHSYRIFTKSKADPRLLDASDFRIPTSITENDIKAMESMSYKQMLAYLQAIEPKIVEEGRHNSAAIILKPEEKAHIQSLFPEKLINFCA